MRVSYRWLQDYVDIPWTVEELAERMTMAGLLVEMMEPMAVGLDDIVVGKVVDVQAHPSAEHLTVVRVRTGMEELTIVTGAPNVALGQAVPVVKPGGRLPDGILIERAEFRGVVSEGMLCSEAELGTGDNADGIWILPPDVVDGRPLVEALGLDDTILHLEVYPNRPDCLSVIGVAREVAALTGGRVKLPTWALDELDESTDSVTSVHVDAADLCSRYAARILRNATIDPSPAWLQQRLRVAGMRPINNVVDVTNFVMWEWGQPLHAFDLDRLAEQRIVVRRALPNERIVTLDDVERQLEPHMLVIADAESPVAIAGVMGGADSEVRHDTTRLLLESATFHPVSVRRTAQAFGLRSEASHRFEKGLDPNTVPDAAARAVDLIHRLAGADVYRGMVDVYPEPVTPWDVRCRPARVRKVLGAHVSDEQIAHHLGALQFDVKPSADGDEAAYDVTVPTYRRDVRREEDLIEEVARLYGYDRLPTTLPAGATAVGSQQPPLPFLDKVRDLLIASGLNECITYSFADPATAEKLRWSVDDSRRSAVPLRNPLREDQSVLRTSMIGGLLDTAARNIARRVTDVHLFEIGAVYLPHALPVTELPAEPRRLGILMTGALPRRTWGDKPGDTSFYELKGVVEQLLGRLRIEATYESASETFLHPGRQAAVMVDGVSLGVLGEVHPQVAAAYDLDGHRVYVAELDADALAEKTDDQVMFTPLPRHPAVQRDMALIVPHSVPAARVIETILEYGGDLVESAELFDVYEGAQVEAGQRSLAYSLRLRARYRTLTDVEANEVLTRIEEALMTDLGVRRRT